MVDNTLLFIAGPVLGFAVFLVSVGTMEGIFYRPTEEGKYEFTMTIFKDYLQVPFQVGTSKFDTIWGNLNGVTLWDRIKMLQLNWVAMTGLGLVVSSFIYFML